MELFKSKKKKSLNNPLMKKGAEVAKKTLSAPIKIAITSLVLTIVGWVLIVVLLAGIFFSIIVGITNFRGEGDDTIPPILGDGSCPCGCIWLPNTTTDGNYGFTTGTLSNSTANEQVINLMKAINTTESMSVPEWVPFGIVSVESYWSADQWYSPLSSTIYETPMVPKQCEGHGIFAGDNFASGEIMTPEYAKNNGIKYMIGPFQIHSMYWHYLGDQGGWTYRCPDSIIQAAGGTVSTTITNRDAEFGSPLYAPDCIYGISKAWGEYISVRADNILGNALGNRYESITGITRDYLKMMYFAFRYHNGGDEAININSDKANYAVERVSYWADVAEKLAEDRAAFDGIMSKTNWAQSSSKCSTVYEIIKIVDPDGSKGYEDIYNKSEGISWIYGPKAAYLGTERYKLTIENAGGNVQTGASSTPNTNTTPSQLDWPTTLFIGDSLTVGLGNNTNLSKSGAVIEAKTGSHIKLDSTDSSGNEVLSAYTRAANHKDMTAVVIAIGSNDFGSNTFESDYQELIDLIKTNNPSAQLYMNTLPPVNDNTASSNGYTCTNADMADKGEIIKTLAQKNGAKLIDIYPELLNSDTQLDPKYSGDGLHLSSEGYREWWDLIRTTLESQGQSSSDSSTPTTKPNDANGHWVCNCEIPCPYCSCHDLPTNEPTDGQETQSRVFPEQKPGEASGLWGTTAELQAAIDSMSDVNLKAKMNTLTQYMGVAPGYERKYTPDKFMGPDGHGIVCYGQTNSGTYGEAFAGLQYSPGDGTFASSGCGAYSLANALSTLEKKWITPPEVAIALNTIYHRTGAGVGPFSGSVITFPGMKELLNEAGYKYEFFDTNDYESTVTLSDGVTTGKLRDIFDDCFKQGGLMIDVFAYPISYNDGGKHYVVITGQDSTGNYQIINSNPPRPSAPTGAGPFTYAELNEYSNTESSGVLLIYPKYKVGGSGTIPAAVNPLLGLAGTDTWGYSSDIFRTGNKANPAQGLRFTAHAGVDMTLGGSANTVGKPVYAMFDGEVIYNSGDTLSSMGHYVVIQHDFSEGTFYTLYQHMLKNSGAAKGTVVKAGDVIGTASGSGVGKNGRWSESAYHAHLHVEVIVDPGPSYKGTGWGVSNKVIVNAGRVIGGEPDILKSGIPDYFEPTSPFDLTQLKVGYTGKSVSYGDTTTTLKKLTVANKGIDYDDMLIRYADSIDAYDGGVKHGLFLQ